MLLRLVDDYRKEEEALLRRGVIEKTPLIPTWLTLSLLLMLAWISAFVTAAIVLKKRQYAQVGALLKQRALSVKKQTAWDSYRLAMILTGLR